MHNKPFNPIARENARSGLTAPLGVNDMERDPSFVRSLLSGMELSETLRSIEIAVWLIFALMLISQLLAYVQARKRKAEETKKGSDWSVLVERAYDSGRYDDDTLQTLATTELLFPKSALVKFWQGRRHFQLEAWEKAAERFPRLGVMCEGRIT